MSRKNRQCVSSDIRDSCLTQLRLAIMTLHTCSRENEIKILCFVPLSYDDPLGFKPERRQSFIDLISVEVGKEIWSASQREMKFLNVVSGKLGKIRVLPAWSRTDDTPITSSDANFENAS